MKSEVYRAASRGYAKHGWLETYHSFSFASYYDPARMGFGALRVLNDDVIAPGSGFGRHPHDNMEIITIPLSGALRHEDSMGNSATIETGEVQVMSAGTGVEHAEWNASTTESLSLLQIWILTANPGATPRYDQRRFDPGQYHSTFFTVVGSLDQDVALGIHQDARISLGRFDAGETAEYIVEKPEQGVYFFIIEGEAMISDTVLVERDAVGVWDTEKVAFQTERGCLVLSIEVPMATR